MKQLCECLAVLTNPYNRGCKHQYTQEHGRDPYRPCHQQHLVVYHFSECVRLDVCEGRTATATSAAAAAAAHLAVAVVHWRCVIAVPVVTQP